MKRARVAWAACVVCAHGILGDAAWAVEPPRSAGAADPDPTQVEAARKLYEEALEAERRGDFAEAQAKLERAATVKLTASLRFHLALCDEKQGRLVSAMTRYEGALEQAIADHKPEVARVVEPSLERLRKTVPTLTLRVARQTVAEDLAVTLDGRTVAPALHEVSMRVELGAHRVEARRPGYRTFFESWDARPGEDHAIAIALFPAEAGAAAARAPAASAPPSRGLAYAAIGGGIAFALLGTASFVHAGSLASDARDVCATSVRPSCDEDRGAIRGFDAAALAGWGLGLAGIGFGTVLLLRAPGRGEPAANHVSSAVRWSPGGVAYEHFF